MRGIELVVTPWYVLDEIYVCCKGVRHQLRRTERVDEERHRIRADVLGVESMTITTGRGCMASLFQTDTSWHVLMLNRKVMYAAAASVG